MIGRHGSLVSGERRGWFRRSQSAENAYRGEFLVPMIPSYRSVYVATAIDPNCERPVAGVRPGKEILGMCAVGAGLSAAAMAFLNRGRRLKHV